ncbi:MAG: hypothetical protein ABII79_01835 [bacterium]
MPLITEESSPGRLRWVVIGCLILVTAVYVGQAWYYRHYVNDDAYITFRYSRLLAMGDGPYFNPGEHVEGYTSLLQMLLLTPVIGWFGPDAAAPAAKTMGVLWGLVAILATWFLTRELLSKNGGMSSKAEFWALGAAAIVAFNAAFALNSTSGLETTLFSMCLIVAVLLAVGETRTGRWHGSGVVFAGAVLARPEGVLLFALFWTAQMFVGLSLKRVMTTSTVSNPGRLRRLLLINGLTVAAVLTAQLIFRYFFYDGEWLPNTYYAKAGGFLRENAWEYISRGILTSFFGLAGITLSLIGYALLRSLLKAAVPLGVITFGGILLPFVTGTDWMLGWRFVIPYLPLMSCFVVVGWGLAATRLMRGRAWLGLLVLPVVVVAQWFIQTEDRIEFHQHTELRAGGYETGHRALADWLRGDACRPGESVALMDIGIVGYRCIEQRIIDISGLTDRHIARSQGLFLQKIYDPIYVLDRVPGRVVLTLTAPGQSYQPPPAGTHFRFWTPIENRIYQHPQFQQLYVHRPAVLDEDLAGLDLLAAQVGAERVFEHAYPGSYYLLAVFGRGPGEHQNHGQ